METRITELENQVQQLDFKYQLLRNLVMGHLERIQAEGEYDQILAGSRLLDEVEDAASEFQQLQGREIVTNV